MAISDVVVANLTTIYLGLIAAMKAYGLVSGRSFSGGFVLIVSTLVVGVVLIVTLTWDVSRKAKATYAISRHPSAAAAAVHHEICRGGICWHGVAVRSPASQVRFRIFRLPQQQQQQQQQIHPPHQNNPPL